MHSTLNPMCVGSASPPRAMALGLRVQPSVPPEENHAVCSYVLPTAHIPSRATAHEPPTRRETVEPVEGKLSHPQRAIATHRVYVLKRTDTVVR